MRTALENFCADIPPTLHEADEILTSYGRWASDRGRSTRTCGSAEGDYRPSGRDALDARREASEITLTVEQRVASQRALARVPEVNRIVLAVLYVPRPQPVGLQLRRLRIPARLSAERHLSGLRMWWNLYSMATRG